MVLAHQALVIFIPTRKLLLLVNVLKKLNTSYSGNSKPDAGNRKNRCY
jgi:hypothetical protein